jgi:hypothetical protein
MTKNKKNKSKSTNQKTVSKAARALGFKNIKEAKNFLTSSNTEVEQPSEAGQASEASFVDTEGFKAVQEELSALMLDPHATDEYIVERAKYLISKHKSQTEACCASACEKVEEKETLQNAKVGEYQLFAIPNYRQFFNNYTITFSV